MTMDDDQIDKEVETLMDQIESDDLNKYIKELKSRRSKSEKVTSGSAFALTIFLFACVGTIAGLATWLVIKLLWNWIGNI